MPFKEMQFKGKRVFVETDDTGVIMEEKGRARMKYKLDDERLYNPYISNLTPSDGGGAMISHTPTRAPNAKSKKPSGAQDLALALEKLRADPSAVIAFTDGACSGNPGPAGLGYTIRFPDGRFVAHGEPLGTATNNIAELTAILRVLEQVKDTSARLVIHTDSSYSIGVLTAGWKAKANQSLIAEIKSLLAKFKRAELRKVKGHAGIEDNEQVDQLAREAAETQQPV